MKIILIEDVDNLGRQGDVVEVKPGFARNFLFRRNLAWQATDGNLKRLANQKKVWEVRQLKEKEQAEQLKGILEGKLLKFEAKVGEEGHLYGSITTSDICEKLETLDVVIDRRKIILPDPIKRAGEHEVQVKLHREVEATLKVEVVSEGDTEAEGN